MQVCGIELKGSEAILCLLKYEKDAFILPEWRQRSFVLANSSDAESIREFQFAFVKLMQDYHVDHICIIERHQKGKLAGSANSFKLEAAIQLTDLSVSLVNDITLTS